MPSNCRASPHVLPPVGTCRSLPPPSDSIRLPAPAKLDARPGTSLEVIADSNAHTYLWQEDATKDTSRAQRLVLTLLIMVAHTTADGDAGVCCVYAG